jgi:nitrogen regulatory protein PII
MKPFQLFKKGERENPAKAEATSAPKGEGEAFEKTHKLEPLYMFMAIVNNGQEGAIVSLLNDNEVAGSYLCHGKGTASNDFYDVLGLSENQKQVITCLVKQRNYPELKRQIEKRFAVSRYAKGVALVVAVDSLCGISAYKFVTNSRPLVGQDKGDTPMEEIQKNDNYEMIMAIVDDGYTDLVMAAAKKAGARGGTILTAHGTGNKDIEKFFGVVITPEKQIVMILVPKEIKDQVMTSIYAECGLNTKGQGIAFSIPASDVIGIVQPSAPNIEETAPEAEPTGENK